MDSEKGAQSANALKVVLDSGERSGAAEKSGIVVLVATDIRNAFSCATWNGIIEGLEKMDVPPYLIRMVEAYVSNGPLLRKCGKSLHWSMLIWVAFPVLQIPQLS